jgi:uncharacterized SAM-binding protein YcdF (DUF218 family)
MPMLWLKLIVKWLLLPPLGPLLVAYGGLAIARRSTRAGFLITFAGIMCLTALAIPAVSASLVRLLDDSPPFDTADAGTAQAIVVLSGGTRLHASEYKGPTLSRITLERVRYAAYLERLTGLPILVSGGSVRGAPPEGSLMRDVLTQELNVPVRWVETRSRDTHENAVNSVTMLRASGVKRIVLVGHSFDFPRTRKEFEMLGMDVIPAPIDIPPASATEVGDFIPSAAGLLQSYYACYEILANALFDITHAFNGSSADTRSTPRSSSPLPRGS